jgi:hypothetical protein
VLREFISHCLVDFIIALAVVTIRRGKAPKVGNGLDIPNDDVARQVAAPLQS